MEQLFNFSLDASKSISKSCVALGLTDFHSVCKYVQQLPYGRNSNRGDFTNILQENKGTCSTKHAFLKQVAIENKANKVLLCLAIYKMKESNTKGVGKILSKQKLDYIPEAHMYLKCNEEIFDFTRVEKSNTSFIKDILFEEQILPKQITNYKIDVHKSFIKSWIKSENTYYSFEEIWEIREACIAALAN